MKGKKKHVAGSELCDNMAISGDSWTCGVSLVLPQIVNNRSSYVTMGYY